MQEPNRLPLLFFCFPLFISFLYILKHHLSGWPLNPSRIGSLLLSYFNKNGKGIRVELLSPFSQLSSRALRWAGNESRGFSSSLSIHILSSGITRGSHSSVSTQFENGPIVGREKSMREVFQEAALIQACDTTFSLFKNSFLLCKDKLLTKYI